jgi:hypothetical protein
MHEATAGLPGGPHQLPTAIDDAYRNAYRALHLAGLAEHEIEARHGRKTEIVVDYELAD